MVIDNYWDRRISNSNIASHELVDSLVVADILQTRRKERQMSQNDTIVIGPFRYNVLKRESHRILVSWVESSGVYKETWILFKKRVTVA